MSLMNVRDFKISSHPKKKKAQEHILVGRQLDVVDPATELKGKTNFIIIDRDHLFQDTLTEVALIDNLRLPHEVNFMGEGAQDFGGH